MLLGRALEDCSASKCTIRIHVCGFVKYRSDGSRAACLHTAAPAHALLIDLMYHIDMMFISWFSGGNQEWITACSSGTAWQRPSCVTNDHCSDCHNNSSILPYLYYRWRTTNLTSQGRMVGLQENYPGMGTLFLRAKGKLRWVLLMEIIPCTIYTQNRSLPSFLVYWTT